MCNMHYQRWLLLNGPRCEVADCNKPQKSRSLCTMHYTRMMRHGNVDTPVVESRICEMKGCDRPALARGWCSKHYQRWLRHNDPNRLFRSKCPEDVEKRFWDKVDKSDDCWTWLGSKGPRGYGIVMIQDRPVKAHRFAYELTYGAIPEDYVIDHICGVTSCVRPIHLRLATRKQNTEHLTQLRRDNTSGVRGVRLTANGRWTAGVRHLGKQYHLGTFDTRDEAEAAAIAKRNELFTHNDGDRK